VLLILEKEAGEKAQEHEY